MFFIAGQNNLIAQKKSKRKTKQERIIECQIPESELKQMPTTVLLDRCLEYKFLVDVTLVDNVTEMMPYLIKGFNGLDELINRRKDAAEVMFNYYVNMEPSKYGENEGRMPPYSYKIFYFTLLLAQDEIIKSFKGRENVVLTELSNKITNMKKVDQNVQGSIFGFMSEGFIAHAMAKYLNSEHNNDFKTLKQNDKKVKKCHEKFNAQEVESLTFNKLFNLTLSKIKK